MSSHNGNGNGNGHTKAFDLVPPKSPEEIAVESNRKIAPEIRRVVRSMRIPAQAKFLFDAILDDTFMFSFGGDGHGQLVASVRDLSRRYGHDKDSLSKWAGVLREKEVLWFNDDWPYRTWRITAICPAPLHKANAVQRVQARASAERAVARLEAQKAAQSPSEGIGSALFLPRNGKSPSKSEETGGTDGNVSPPLAEDRGQSDRHLPPDAPIPSARNRRQLPPDAPIPSAILAEASPHDAPKVSERPSEGKGRGVASRPVKSGRKAKLETSPVQDREILKTILSSSTAEGASGAVSGPPGDETEQFSGSTAVKFDLEAERDFLERLGRITGPKEIANWGGRWRNRYREDPEKAKRVLSELASMHRENRIVRNAGACADDLWGRFA